MPGFTILIGIIGGLAVGLQTPIANTIGQRLGGASGSLIVHLSGALFSGLLLMARSGESLRDWRAIPWWMYGVGLFGVVLFLTITYTIPRIGAAPAIALIIVGQLSAGMVIDHFGLFGVAPRPVDMSRLLGVGLLLAGGYLISR